MFLLTVYTVELYLIIESFVNLVNSGQKHQKK